LYAATKNILEERGSNSGLTAGISSPEMFQIIKEKMSYPAVEEGKDLAFFVRTLKCFFSTAIVWR